MKSLLLFSLLVIVGSVLAQEKRALPQELEGWRDWALWQDKERKLPKFYDDVKRTLPLWCGPLELKAEDAGGSFALTGTSFESQWIALPGGAETWPYEVLLNGAAVPVLNHNGEPRVELKTEGEFTLTGSLRWASMPQKIRMPGHIGILRLSLKGALVELPTWGTDDQLWLQRTSTEPADKDFLAKEVYRLIEDGSPQWLRTWVELTVAGKSREETLGHVLPEGWKLSAVEGALPCAVDDAGLLKVQVRSGKWMLKLDAFRTSPATTVNYAAGTKPLVAEELVGLQSKSGFRVIEITGLGAVDVAQTRYPEEWRKNPVYQWPTGQAFEIQENMRGMGEKKPPGVSIERRFWLDEDGGSFTYLDQMNGQAQQTWRLDAAQGHELGAVKIGGKGQLITKNPGSGATGVEVRERNLSLQAVGRLARSSELSATGWQKDAESLKTHLHLPPGWRLFAVFGTDWSSGDWLTAWSLYDVFLLLLFGLTLQRLWGWGTALVGVLCFITTYHEPDAPQWTWLLLVVVLAAASLIKQAQPALTKLKLLALLFLAASAVPFCIQQVQQALYPQLEPYRYTWQSSEGNLYMAGGTLQTAAADAPAAPAPVTSYQIKDAEYEGWKSQVATRAAKAADSFLNYASNSSFTDLNSYRVDTNAGKNLGYDKKAKIQTGPAIPNWQWRQVSFGWRGPVAQGETVKLWLIPCSLTRVISLARVALTAALLWLLLRGRGFSFSLPSVSKPIAAAGLALLSSFSAAQAEYPSADLLKELRERLLEEQRERLEDKKVLPQRAEIPEVKLKLTGHKLEMEVTVHHLGRVAVPLPGRLPAWSPQSVELLGGESGRTPATALRFNSTLWVLLPEDSSGLQTYRVTGLIPPGAEWQWSGLLKPRHVVIDAPDWTFTGVSPDGVPEEQVFFTEKQRSTSAEAAYDQKEFHPVVVLERSIELGLLWQVKNTARRIGPTGKAVTLSVPLLPTERVLTPDAKVEKGRMQLSFGAGDEYVNWESELEVQPELKLTAEQAENVVERWKLNTSPMWNVEAAGLAPVFEANEATLISTWSPWPTETVTLSIKRPDAITGETVTVHKSVHEITLGDRQQLSELTLSVQASLGEDFPIELPAGAEVTKLMLAGVEQSVRKEGGKIILPLQVGEQDLVLHWKLPQPLSRSTSSAAVKLPVSAANLSTTLTLPSSRWLLWASGPMRGPAIRFWGMCLSAVLLGYALSRIRLSPLGPIAWALLLLGFMQVPLIMGGTVVVWFFALSWRKQFASTSKPDLFNLMQVALLAAGVVTLFTLLAVVHAGLLGRPDMFVTGFGSSTERLNWFQDRSPSGMLTQVTVVSTSIWVYRALMLLWALWLARSVLRWIPWAWSAWSEGGVWKKEVKKVRQDAGAPSANAINRQGVGAPKAPPSLPKAED